MKKLLTTAALAVFLYLLSPFALAQSVNVTVNYSWPNDIGTDPNTQGYQVQLRVNTDAPIDLATDANADGVYEVATAVYNANFTAGDVICARRRGWNVLDVADWNTGPDPGVWAGAACGAVLARPVNNSAPGTVQLIIN